MAAYSSRSRRASTATWMLGFGIGVIVVLDWRPVNSEADLESDDRHLLEALQDGPSPQAGEINDLVRIVILVAFVGFELRPFELELFRYARSQRSAFAEAGTGIAPYISEASHQTPRPVVRVA